MSQHDDLPHETLRLHRVRQDEPPDPTDSAYAVDRLTVLAHELGNLLDGALRCLGLARTSLGARAATTAGGELEATRRQLETVHESLERMASLVEGASHTTAKTIVPGPVRSTSLVRAIRHAIDVTSPNASELGIEIADDIAPSLESVPAGPVYPVILNALANAVDSIATCTGAGRGGRIEVTASLDERGTGVIVRIRDDGAGPPQSDGGASVFDLGFTTKPGGAGIGLAVSRDVIAEMGGTIELRRTDEAREPGRPGAELVIEFPIPSMPGDNWIG